MSAKSYLDMISLSDISNVSLENGPPSPKEERDLPEISTSPESAKRRMFSEIWTGEIIRSNNQGEGIEPTKDFLQSTYQESDKTLTDDSLQAVEDTLDTLGEELTRIRLKQAEFKTMLDRAKKVTNDILRQIREQLTRNNELLQPRTSTPIPLEELDNNVNRDHSPIDSSFIDTKEITLPITVTPKRIVPRRSARRKLNFKECSFCIERPSSIKRTIRRIKKRIFRCNSCPKAYRHLSSLNRHESQTHIDSPLRCFVSDCKQTFTSKKKRDVHIKKNPHTNFACSCGALFNEKINFELHCC